MGQDSGAERRSEAGHFARPPFPGPFGIEALDGGGYCGSSATMPPTLSFTSPWLEPLPPCEFFTP